jgi:[acyl-carrier-protein] S-malonyltransferase
LTDAQRKVAFLFPGQGSQKVGMGKDLAEAFPAAHRVFEEVDDALQSPISRVAFEGPDEALRETFNAQPALLATSIACLRALEETLPAASRTTPNYVAGHSLGEFSALVAAGSLSLADAARLVRARGLAMQHASQVNPGGMAAVLGLDELTVEEVCQETGVQIANVNADDQIVIAGTRLALARALDLLSARGAKRAISLQVSGAFHSRLMSAAVERFLDALETAAFKDPAVPVVANVLAKPLTSADEIKETLKRQLLGCVQWHRSVLYMHSMGVNTTYEFGPGKVLTNLIKRVAPDVHALNVSDLVTLQAAAS